MSETLNSKLKGLHRDRKILQTIEEYQALSTEQVQALFFQGMQYGKRKAQERLLKLYQTAKLDRTRTGDEPYIYFSGEKPGLLKHLIAVNWVRIWLEQQCHSWEKMHSWQYEQDYKVLRTDGFAAVKNTAKGTFKFNFVEMDRGTNNFDKVKKYNKLYEQEKYLGWWWVELTERFPTVLVVTTSPTRKRQILELVKSENVHGLEFDVRLLDDLKGEVMVSC